MVQTNAFEGFYRAVALSIFPLKRASHKTNYAKFGYLLDKGERAPLKMGVVAEKNVMFSKCACKGVTPL